MTAIHDHRIYLASRSPRRRELLTQIGVRFELLLFRETPRSLLEAMVREDDPTHKPSSDTPIEVDETPLPNENPEAYVVRVTLAKAQAGLQRMRERRLISHPILAADTAVEMDGTIIGKPENDADATAILKRLSGGTHRVLTAVAVVEADRVEHLLNINEVRFRTLEDNEIKRYIASGESHDKAGAYGVQGRAALFIEEIRGSYTGIMGLPLFETAILLRRFGYPL